MSARWKPSPSAGSRGSSRRLSRRSRGSRNSPMEGNFREGEWFRLAAQGGDGALDAAHDLRIVQWFRQDGSDDAGGRQQCLRRRRDAWARPALRHVARADARDDDRLLRVRPQREGGAIMMDPYVLEIAGWIADSLAGEERAADIYNHLRDRHPERAAFWLASAKGW